MPKISQLPTTNFPSLEHEVPASQGGETHRLSIATIRELMKFAASEIAYDESYVSDALDSLGNNKTDSVEFEAFVQAIGKRLDDAGLANVDGPRITNANDARSGEFNSFLGSEAASIAANFPAIGATPSSNRLWYLFTGKSGTTAVQTAILGYTSNDGIRGRVYTRAATGTSWTPWRRLATADEVVSVTEAQALTEAQRQQGRSNLGLGGEITDPWSFQPIGVPIPILGPGTLYPSNSAGAYKYVMLTSARSDYHGTMLTNESLSGAHPLTVATARVNLVGSPLHNQTVRLLNNEARVLRAGYQSQVGNVEQDAIQRVQGDFSGRNTHGGGATLYNGTGALYVTDGADNISSVQASSTLQPRRVVEFDNARVARTDNETRVKNVRVCYIMRIL